MITGKRVTAFLAALLVCVGFILPMPAQAATLTYWYSTASTIGRWTYSPQIYYFSAGLVNGEVPINAGVGIARSVWNEGLGTSITISTTNDSAPIHFGAITANEYSLANTRVTYPIRELLGIAEIQHNASSTHQYNGTSITQYTITGVTCYVFWDTRNSYSNYMHTIAHELGHAMGWYGHPTSYQSTWVMEDGFLTTTTLKTNERNHLAQIY